MEATRHQFDLRHTSHDASDNGTVRVDMEATADAFFAADGAHVHEAMKPSTGSAGGYFRG